MHTDKNSALELLRELAMHVRYDHEVNDAKFNNQPVGRVPIGPKSFWTQGVASHFEETGEIGKLINDINSYLQKNVSLNSDYAILPISSQKDSLWQRIQSHFTVEPDVLHNIVLPAAVQELKFK